jgi:hypothetical protein
MKSDEQRRIRCRQIEASIQSAFAHTLVYTDDVGIIPSHPPQFQETPPVYC